MSRSAYWVLLLALTAPVGLAACAASRSGPPPARTGASVATETGPVAASEPGAASNVPSWTLVAFGDSWPYGAHCHGCRPFPRLYADGLAATTAHHIEFVNLTTNGGTSQSLLASIQSSPEIRQAVASADIIIISTGMNDLEPAGKLYVDGHCGGLDQLDCLREAANAWRISFGGMLTEINALRRGHSTAIRLVSNSNEFLSDAELIQIFGPSFGLGAGASITDMHHDILNEVATRHGAICVDLRPVLNGASHQTPRDVNSQEAMQAVADALLASGHRELR
jgi:hypothetical protein